jgi:cell wall-associated NlpC family hydrolase
MNEKERLTSAARHEVVSLARSQIGAHYLLGAAGATPGNSDGAWYRKNGVKMHDIAAKGNRKDHGRKCPMVYAAFLQGQDKRVVCGGRYNQKEVDRLPEGDPTNPIHLFLPQVYKWERPSRVIEADKSVWGEACMGIRHFDCVHFVNWVYRFIIHKHFGITRWIKTAKEEVKNFANAQPGDILTATKPRRHIGIVASPSTVVHASDNQWGVVETNIRDGHWNRCGRLPSSLWLEHLIESSPGYDPIDEEGIS